MNYSIPWSLVKLSYSTFFSYICVYVDLYEWTCIQGRLFNGQEIALKKDFQGILDQATQNLRMKSYQQPSSNTEIQLGSLDFAQKEVKDFLSMSSYLIQALITTYLVLFDHFIVIFYILIKIISLRKNLALFVKKIIFKIFGD